MSTRTRRVVFVLTCMACTSAAAAQSPPGAQAQVLILREQATPQRALQAPRNVQRRGPAPPRGGEATEVNETVSRTAQLVGRAAEVSRRGEQRRLVMGIHDAARLGA